MGPEIFLLLYPVLWIVGLVILYQIIRAAVRGGIEDAWARRARRQQPPPQPGDSGQE